MMEQGILVAVATADLIICSIGQALVFVGAWVAFAGGLGYIIHRRRKRV